MQNLSDFEPRAVLKFFSEICSIPHGSGNTDMISNYLADFARKRSLSYRQDLAGNVIIWKAGSSGYEQASPVIIQGHMDMVAVKENDCQINLEAEGLALEIIERASEKWLSAAGTSLGGDDGIAVAYALALLDSSDIPHPPLEAVFTVDEEIGMLGAAQLDTSDLKGRTLINIDSEDEGIFTVSCAGGLTAVSKLKVEKEEIFGEKLYVCLNGFTGGHSGVEINKGRLNACLTMGRLLNILEGDNIRIISINGGDKDNAIPCSCEAELLLISGSSLDITIRLKAEFDTIKKEYEAAEKSLSLIVSPMGDFSEKAFDKKATDSVINILLNIPNGIQRMNPDIENMVQTSLNLGILKTSDSEVTFCSSLRSSSESEKKFLLEKYRKFMMLFCAELTVSGDYPGWSFSPVSRLRDTFSESFRLLYGYDPIIEGVHAGLECGIFASKIKGLDCISVGPQMTQIHTVNEALNLSSVNRTWELIKKVLEKYN